MSTARSFSKLARDAQAEGAFDIGYDTDKSIPQKEDVEARLGDVTTAQATKDASQDSAISAASDAAAAAQGTADGAVTQNGVQDGQISNLQTADADNVKKSGTLDQLSDVDFTTAPTEDTVLTYDAVSGTFKPEAIPATDLSAYQTTAQADDKYVDVAGDSMTGTLLVNTINTTAGDLTLDSATNRVIIDGDLQVTGSRVESASETSTYQQAFLNLNTNATGVPLDTQDAGLLVNRGDSPEAQLIWDESQDRFTASTDAGTTQNVLAYSSEVATAQAAADAAQTDATQALSDAATANSTNGTQQTQINQNQTDIAALQTADGNNVKTTDSVDVLGDVDTTTAAPTNGQVLVWDGTNWVPGTVAATDTRTEITNIDITAIDNQSEFAVPHGAGTIPWVTLNGIRLKPTTDYTHDATAGTVTLLDPAAAGDDFAALAWSVTTV